ncbi:hypothetical protein GUJ93_ZPchr0010g8589 [Zizania palustris]|uniref:non-specific serine/threonine protein kinase n=1 Tax=Zizania palustris TaxID=103762 RepID=A0A8J6BGM6_ZIZPA|nr:hypothetical protein GUJ93_ZPchr0010g8589 [Zizania palustris]
MTGVIPDEITNCTSLEEVDFFGNHFHGPIPEKMGNLKNLAALALADNRLSGELPESFGRLTELSVVTLYNNSLEGPLPASLFELKNLTVINVSHNRFTGGIVPLLGSSSLAVLALTTTALRRHSVGGRAVDRHDPAPTGWQPAHRAIPTELGRLTGLKILDLSNNNFSGDIPPELFNCSRLTRLNLEGNSLTGAIPSWLGRLRSLGELDLSSNAFTGRIPVELGDCSGLLKLKRPHRRHTAGDQAVQQAVRAAAVGESLEGAIPPELGQLLELQVILDLSQNRLSGEIPASLGNLVKLERLNLSSNGLHGQIPSSLQQLTSLHLLNLSDNLLSGAIPGALSSFPAASFAGNDELCGAPLPRSSSCRAPRRLRLRLLGAEVSVIVAAIAVVSAAVCVALLYIMLRMWSNWRAVSVDLRRRGVDGLTAAHGKAAKWGARDGKYWKVGSVTSAAEGKYSSTSSETSVLHGKPARAVNPRAS